MLSGQLAPTTSSHRHIEAMYQPPWKSLVETLKNSGFQSPYLERLYGRMPTGEAHHQSVEQEILQEMASGLSTAAAKVDLALLRVDLIIQDLEQAITLEEQRALLKDYEARRQDVRTARWELIVHREALGLTNHDQILLDYPLPPPKKLHPS